MHRVIRNHIDEVWAATDCGRVTRAWHATIGFTGLRTTVSDIQTAITLRRVFQTKIVVAVAIHCALVVGHGSTRRPGTVEGSLADRVGIASNITISWYRLRVGRRQVESDSNPADGCQRAFSKHNDDWIDADNGSFN